MWTLRELLFLAEILYIDNLKAGYFEEKKFASGPLDELLEKMF